MPHEIIGIPLQAFYDTVILYGFGHGVWIIIKRVEKRIETESAHIIRKHVKSGHGGHFKQCLIGECSRLESPEQA